MPLGLPHTTDGMPQEQEGPGRMKKDHAFLCYTLQYPSCTLPTKHNVAPAGKGEVFTKSRLGQSRVDLELRGNKPVTGSHLLWLLTSACTLLNIFELLHNTKPTLFFIEVQRFSPFPPMRRHTVSAVIYVGHWRCYLLFKFNPSPTEYSLI